MGNAFIILRCVSIGIKLGDEFRNYYSNKKFIWKKVEYKYVQLSKSQLLEALYGSFNIVNAKFMSKYK